MIHAAINCMAGQLNEFLGRVLATAEDIVVVSNLLGPDGAIAPNVTNKILLFLTAIERDSSTRAAEPPGRAFSGTSPLYLNIYVMVAANFTGQHYPDALRLLSLAVGFFNERAVLDRFNSPDLDKSIGKLILDIENTTPQVASNIWGVLGGRYLPSVLYRVRVLAIDNDAIRGRLPRVNEPAVAANNSGGGGDERLP